MAFPEISISHRGGDTGNEAEFFGISIPEVNRTEQDTLKSVYGENPEDALQAYRTAIQPANRILENAASICNQCQVSHEVCNRIKVVDLAMTVSADSYEALLQVHGASAYTVETVRQQILGNLCGLTAERLNAIHSVKMK